MQQNFRVLLVEDDDSLRVCLREFLADHGWVVAATARGDEAIALAQVEQFDFSILDFHLSGGTTGLQVFQAIRRFSPLPAILMSGAANREETDLAQRAGFFTFLRKPLQLDHLRQSVHMLIEHHFGASSFGLIQRRPHQPPREQASPSRPNPSQPNPSQPNPGQPNSGQPGPGQSPPGPTGPDSCGPNPMGPGNEPPTGRPRGRPHGRP